MADQIEIRLLETDPNQLGDLFARLAEDYFLSLGYENCRLNIHKTGREIDVFATHRTEARVAVGECKAVNTLVGGADLNKFAGVLEVERDRLKGTPLTGYFLSLSGFKESAKEQEAELSAPRAILVDSDDVARELVKGRIVISREGAADLAGRLAGLQAQPLKLEPAFELLGHNIGWLWAVYFGSGMQRTHFALIHADGEALSADVAASVVAMDETVGGSLASLEYLSPPDSGLTIQELQTVRDRYFTYLANEYGWLTLEGLPADQEVGSRQLALEALFVPLHVEPIQPSPAEERPRGHSGLDTLTLFEEYLEDDEDEADDDRQSVGDVLASSPRLAILADPGAGKSTLLKRLAIAYAFPGRQGEVDDGLPSRDWLPLIFRCRQVGDQVTEPVVEILKTIPHRAEMPDLSASFERLVAHYLRKGNVLLLIDGLDEISDEKDRVIFVKQLRTFLATYPAISAVITSREAGFRIVAPALATVCSLYRLADFSAGDIERLTEAWHRQVVGDSGEVASRARGLARKIVTTDRVRRLAGNPLLLTTLLLVHRWVGELPRKRTTLYAKAIEVLLMTWNVEGHRPIDQDEAIPQLAFVASAMFDAGEKTISVRRLRGLLQTARDAMPEILAYTKLSVTEFVDRVEDRSSVLSLSGHGLEDGVLVELYEFKHLTFQEYLAAVAISEGYLLPTLRSAEPVTLLRPRIGDPDWREVIPLAAVLLGRRAASLVEALIEELRRAPSRMIEPTSRANLAYPALAQSIADEVQISPELARKACDWLARRHREGRAAGQILAEILTGRYGDLYRSSIEAGFMKGNTRSHLYSSAFVDLSIYDLIGERRTASAVERRIMAHMDSSAPMDQAKGACALMSLVFGLGVRTDSGPEWYEMANRLGDKAAELMLSSDPAVTFASSWALAWLGIKDAWRPDRAPQVLARLLSLWRESPVKSNQEWSAWALGSLPLIDRESKPLGKPNKALIEFLTSEERREDWRSNWRKDRGPAAIVASYYLGKPWTDDELANMALEREFGRAEDLLEALGRRSGPPPAPRRRRRRPIANSPMP